MNRGKNDLLEACYRDIGRAAFHIDLLVVTVIIGAIAAVWRFL